MFGCFDCCREREEKSEHKCCEEKCEHKCREEDCFRPSEHVCREKFVKETRCKTHWHREDDCREEKKECERGCK